MPANSHSAQQQDLPVFDEASLLTQLGGSRDLAKTIALSAINDIPGYFDKLEKAVSSDDWSDERKVTHTMKGLIAQIGGARLASRLKALDDHLRAGGHVDVATTAELRKDYRLLENSVLKWTQQPD
jgi:HPt (histidine-containing phosphotransfer) domain-containing protein